MVVIQIIGKERSLEFTAATARTHSSPSLPSQLARDCCRLPVWYGWREGASHYWCGDRDQGDVWRIDRPSVSEAHLTTKPLALVERAIENSSRPGDLVCDLFLGSGSTLVACECTGRVCYGIEIDPHYASMVIARWESFTGETATRIEGGSP
jgi:hypothetical protein